VKHSVPKSKQKKLLYDFTKEGSPGHGKIHMFKTMMNNIDHSNGPKICDWFYYLVNGLCRENIDFKARIVEHERVAKGHRIAT
jgi:hypothetical protein